MDADKQLEELRKQIDALDDQIQELISQRARFAQNIAKIKQQEGSEFFYRPDREAVVLQRILDKNPGPLADEEIARLFREIMSACLALESPLTIAFLGPEGTFTQEAALKHFGHSVNTKALGAIDEVFREVESGAVHFGVVPIENSTEGVVNHTLDSFVASPLQICGEVEMRIHHHLLGKGKNTKGIKQVVSHQQSLAQCREWLDANLPGVERVTAGSNAEAAQLAAKKTSIAAIASDHAAEYYGLNILTSNIEDEPDNTTRFLVIGRLETQPSGNDKTTLLISGNNRPGLLHNLLMPLAENKINMTRIESRPSRRGMWEYIFFIDIEGHIKEDKVRKTVAELEKEAALVKRLGSYPRAVL